MTEIVNKGMKSIGSGKGGLSSCHIEKIFDDWGSISLPLEFPQFIFILTHIWLLSFLSFIWMHQDKAQDESEQGMVLDGRVVFKVKYCVAITRHVRLHHLLRSPLTSWN